MGKTKGAKKGPKFPLLGAQVPPQQKQPRVEELPSVENQRPAWLLRRLEKEGDWGWEDVGRAALLKIWSRLASFESMTWGEIRKQKSCHFTETDSIDAKALKRLQTLKLDDTDALYQFQIGQVERLWGIRIGRDFLALWWDPAHTVCPVGLKNT